MEEGSGHAPQPLFRRPNRFPSGAGSHPVYLPMVAQQGIAPCSSAYETAASLLCYRASNGARSQICADRLPDTNGVHRYLCFEGVNWSPRRISQSQCHFCRVMPYFLATRTEMVSDVGYAPTQWISQIQMQLLHQPLLKWWP